MSKHTPGPWQINAISNEREKISIIDADMCFVAEVWKTYVNGESRQQANASLIAAAPELLEACQALLDGILFTRGASMSEDRRRTLTTIARQAINKAEGRGGD